MCASVRLQSALHLFYFTVLLLLALLLLLPIHFDFHLKWAVPISCVSHWSCISLAHVRMPALLPRGCRAIKRSSARSYQCSAVGSRAVRQHLVLLPGVFVDCGEFPTTGVLNLSTLRQRRQQRKKEKMSRRPRCCCCTFFFFSFSVAAAALFYLCMHMWVCMCTCTLCTKIEL